VADLVAKIEIEITQELLLLIAEIDEFKGRWRVLNTLAPDRLAALRKIATIESVGSSTRIEGARLSDRQVQELANVGKQSFADRDEQEVAGYAEVMDLIFQAGSPSLSPKITLSSSTRCY
jgi:Fic family protein